MQRLIFLTAIIFSLPAFSQQLFQVTTATTAPGETVLIRGEGMQQITKIEVGRLADDPVNNATPVYVALPQADRLPDPQSGKFSAAAKMTVVDKVQQNEKSVKLIIPKDLQKGIFSVRLTNNNGNVSGFYVNVPIANWAISEAGLNAAAPGSVVRIQGKHLYKGQVILLNGNKATNIKVDSVYDDYSVKVTLPANLSPGKYQLFYHNGFGGKTAWSAPLSFNIVNKELWKTQVYKVKKEGTTEDFKAAIAAAHDGGIVAVPAGIYVLSEGLTLPPGVILKGASQKETVLIFKSDAPLQSLITGTHHFGVTDMTIQATRALGVIMNTSTEGHVQLERLLVQQEYSNTTELDSKWNKTGIQLKGSHIIVRDCVFKMPGMFSFIGVSGFIQRNRFEKTGKSVKPYMVVHPKGLIFEDCFKQVNGYGYGATIDESHDLYEARNVIPFNFINDREVMTFDGGSGGYYGKVGAVNGNSIILAKSGQTFQWKDNKWIGGGLFIVDGKGTGQFRRIIKHTGDKIELDAPFLVAPDTGSVISITTIRQHLYFINNNVSDGGAFQFFGSAQNCLVAGLKIKRSAGIVGRGSFVNYGRQPNWYIDIVNCELSEGTYTPQLDQKDKFRGDQQINIIGSGGSGLNIGTMVRGNVLSGKSYIRVSPGGEINDVQDAIIESNKVSGAQNGLAIHGQGRVLSNIFIHDNQFGTVDIHKALKAESYQMR